jgi:hypothetical protein
MHSLELCHDANANVEHGADICDAYGDGSDASNTMHIAYGQQLLRAAYLRHGSDCRHVWHCELLPDVRAGTHNMLEQSVASWLSVSLHYVCRDEGNTSTHTSIGLPSCFDGGLAPQTAYDIDVNTGCPACGHVSCVNAPVSVAPAPSVAGPCQKPNAATGLCSQVTCGAGEVLATPSDTSCCPSCVTVSTSCSATASQTGCP